MPTNHNETEAKESCVSESQLDQIQQMLVQLSEKFEEAFPMDEYGKPFLVGHREYHKKRMKQEEQMDDYRHEFTKKLVVIVGTAFVGFVSSGFLPWLLEKLGGK